MSMANCFGVLKVAFNDDGDHMSFYFLTRDRLTCV